jgi:hypothetical protein
MNAKRWYLVELALFVSTLFLIACFPEGFQERPDGVIIKLEKSSPTDARLLKIQICTASIIRVVASPGEAFSTSPSLMVCQNKWKPVAHTIRKNGNRIQISTSKLMTEVALKTGEIAFYNKDGRLLLQEKPGGSKTFSKTEVMGEKTYQIRQLFLSSPDEAFYGLGQHQNAVMNWKGHDLDMFQYNLVDIVPFVISSRNYGILWDNNSRMKFGDIRDYQPLSTLKMFGIDGKEGGLTAEYFRDEQFQNLVSTRQESIMLMKIQMRWAAIRPVSEQWEPVFAGAARLHRIRQAFMISDFTIRITQKSGWTASSLSIHGVRTGAPGRTCAACRWISAETLMYSTSTINSCSALHC